MAAWSKARDPASASFSETSDPLSRRTRRRLARRWGRDGRLDDLCNTLWELEHGAPADAGASRPLVSPEERGYLSQAVQDFGVPPANVDPLGSFVEIQGVTDYAGERCDLAPTNLEVLSLPPPGFVPRRMEELLQEDGEVFDRRVSQLVVSPETATQNQESQGLSKPYTGPRLRGRKQYTSLVNRLLSSNLIELSLQDGTGVCVFTVWKSDGKRQRLIIDARLSNCHLSEPEAVDLPSAANISHLCCEISESVSISTSDLKDAFYTIELPQPF